MIVHPKIGFVYRLQHVLAYCKEKSGKSVDGEQHIGKTLCQIAHAPHRGHVRIVDSAFPPILLHCSHNIMKYSTEIKVHIRRKYETYPNVILQIVLNHTMYLQTHVARRFWYNFDDVNIRNKIYLCVLH